MAEMKGKPKHIRCGKCDFLTDSAVELARHIKALHVRVRNDSRCPDCEFKAATISALLLHIKATHRKEAENTTEPVKIASEIQKVSYFQMICEALKPAKNRMLLHSEICAFISKKYPSFKMEDESWQDDIRQTLSQRFKKVPRKHLPPTPLPIKGELTETESKPNEEAIKSDVNISTSNVNDWTLEKDDGNDFNDIVDEELNESGQFHFAAENFNMSILEDTAAHESETYNHASLSYAEGKDYHQTDSLGYKCNLCDHETPRKANMEIHVKAVHYKIRDYMCFICGYATSRTNYLAHHMKKSHDKIISFQRGPYEKVLPVKGPEQDEAHSQQLEVNLSDDLGKESNVGLTSKNDESADIYQLETSSGKNIFLECPHCEMKLSSGQRLASHIRQWHGIKCPQCEIHLNSNAELENHWRICVSSQDLEKSAVEESATRLKLQASSNVEGKERGAKRRIILLRRNRPKTDQRSIQSRTCCKCSLVTDSPIDLYRHFMSVHSDYPKSQFQDSSPK